MTKIFSRRFASPWFLLQCQKFVDMMADDKPCRSTEEAHSIWGKDLYERIVNYVTDHGGATFRSDRVYCTQKTYVQSQNSYYLAKAIKQIAGFIVGAAGVGAALATIL